MADSWNSKGYPRNSIASILFNGFGVDHETEAFNSDLFNDRINALQDSDSQVPYIQGNLNRALVRVAHLETKHVRGKPLLFLNPDSGVPGHIIEHLYSRLRSQAGGSGLNNYDRPNRTAVGLNFDKES